MIRRTLPLLALLMAPLAIAQPYEIPPIPPLQAIEAGYWQLSFDDEFNSPDTVSPDGTGNYNWYRSNFYSSSLTLPASGYSIQDGYLTLKTDTSGYSNGLQTADPENTSQAWTTGYFEARIRFNPGGSQGEGWPAFWSSSIAFVTKQTPVNAPFSELDFMEYYTQGTQSTYITDVHQITNNTAETQVQGVNAPKIPAGNNFATWHTYGCLWTPTTVRWYFDNKLVATVAIGPNSPYSVLDQSKMFVILGTGVNWPMDVDYVRIWQ